MASRVVHVVRCKKKNDPSTFFDIIVTNGISFIGRDGNEVVLISPAQNAQPTIIDQTDGGNGITSPDPTRMSHMVEVDGQDDTADGGQDNTGNGFYAEILDGVEFTSRNGDEVVLLTPTSVETVVIANPYNLPYVAPNDTTVNFGEGGGTRGGTITRVDNGDSNSTGGTDYVNGINPNAIANYVTVYQSLVFCFRGRNGDVENIVFDANATVANGGLLDETVYVDDGSGNMVPPDNADPNLYVAFNDKFGSIITGDVLINQGMLWQIIKASGVTCYATVTWGFDYFTITRGPTPHGYPTGPGTFSLSFPDNSTSKVLGQSSVTITDTSDSVILGTIGNPETWDVSPNNFGYNTVPIPYLIPTNSPYVGEPFPDPPFGPPPVRMAYLSQAAAQAAADYLNSQDPGLDAYAFMSQAYRPAVEPTIIAQTTVSVTTLLKLNAANPAFTIAGTAGLNQTILEAIAFSLYSLAYAQPNPAFGGNFTFTYSSGGGWPQYIPVTPYPTDGIAAVPFPVIESNNYANLPPVVGGGDPPSIWDMQLPSNNAPSTPLPPGSWDFTFASRAHLQPDGSHAQPWSPIPQLWPSGGTAALYDVFDYVSGNPPMLYGAVEWLGLSVGTPPPPLPQDGG